ncbi:hypothetical protein PV433_11400 [Paenibacillus sp. GYB004]|uniref:hypothetical protein n=1 Tax=Paenibacillus sp. GYB004 TaxID=2994393 RepID=UPI002F966BBC
MATSTVILRTHDKGQDNWAKEYYSFERIPIEGELIAFSDSEWYQVEMVVHTPFAGELAADVYAVKVEQDVVKKGKLNI